MPQDPKEALKAFEKAVAELSDAADRLLVAWDKLGRADDELSVDVARAYPFDKDFYELTLDIHAWKHVIRTMVKVDWPGPREWLPKQRK